MLCPNEGRSLGGFHFGIQEEILEKGKILMPIITPAYPYTNTSYNVSLSRLCVMQEEVESINEICETIEVNKTGLISLCEPFLLFE